METGAESLRVERRIAALAKLLAALRSRAADWREDTYTPASTESPLRAFAVLTNLASGHALVHGRKYLTMEDFPMVAKTALSSIPDRFTRVFTALVKAGGTLTTEQVRAALRV